MLIDKENLLSDGQALTATAASTNIIDLGAARELGTANIRLRVQVDAALTSGGSSTLTIALQTDDNASFSSATALFTTAAIPKASLVAGYVAVDIVVPKGTERYLRLNYTVGTADFTAGNISAFLVLNEEAIRAYPNGI